MLEDIVTVGFIVAEHILSVVVALALPIAIVVAAIILA